MMFGAEIDTESKEDWVNGILGRITKSLPDNVKVLAVSAKHPKRLVGERIEQ
jgi:hypothetical protein